MLPIAMTMGASSYLIYHSLSGLHSLGCFLSDAMGMIQPLLIFLMLFLTFCTLEPKDLKPHRWHWWLLLIQGGMFAVLGLIAVSVIKFFPAASEGWRVMMESAMLCFICPTATAAAVVTRKLGGDVPGITTYIVLINLLTAILVPLVIPMIQPESSLGFWVSFKLILAKVFPLLITPCLCAWLVRYLLPGLHRKLLSYPDLAFYIWAVALTFAIAVTTKSIVNSTMPAGLILVMASASLVCCVVQFAAGRFVGSQYKPRRGASNAENEAELLQRGKAVRKITAGQSLGQKNTVFAIWLGYTFMTPETAIVGGLYSIWHNIYNSWQLNRSNNDMVSK